MPVRVALNLARVLDGCEVEALAFEPAKRAGALRWTLPETVGPVDATVAETARGSARDLGATLALRSS